MQQPKTNQPLTFNSMVITPAQIVEWCAIAGNNTTLTPTQITTLGTIAKTVVYYNSATNRHYTGHNAVGSNCTKYGNVTTNTLYRWQITTNKKGGSKPAWVAYKKGLKPAIARKLGYFKYSSAVKTGSFAARKGAKNANTLCIATSLAAMQTGLAFTHIAHAMGFAGNLPPCNTWV